MSYDVQILVNGNRCKQYHHDGKIFIEAKEGSEYSIELKNNEWKRILAVCSVDGLDILTGKIATTDSPGYVINGLNSSRFDGFRVSNEKVAKFVFDYKNASYAASKEDGAEKNVGVIGVRIFDEKITPPPVTIREKHHHHHWPKRYPWDDYGTPVKPYYPSYPIWCDTTWTRSLTGELNDVSYGSCVNNSVNNEPNTTMDWMDSEPERSVKGGLEGRSSGIMMNATFNASTQQPLSSGPSEKVLRGFDMGTKWGEAKESKVVEVDFERNALVFTTNIYYASRQSLIEMGVPLGNEKQVSFPEPFADSKYAKPPKGWKP